MSLSCGEGMGTVEDFEKLGVFYLGRRYDLTTKSAGSGLLLYDSRDLLTHGVCIGMTGSGKTGLCLGLLEEAAIDRIPVIAIDPKGDLSNLLLTFPDLRSEDFLPWVNEDDARRKGISVEAYASEQAEMWKRGLDEWGQSGDRIRALKSSAEFAIYTPGSTAGLPISILHSFSCPSAEILEDSDAMRDRLSSSSTSLLALLGIAADPLKSKEHILVSNILSALWKDGRDVTLPELIQQIQNPPFTRIGAFDCESFYPAKERFQLAMALNNILAAPGFETWLQGEPLNIDKLLHAACGRPRVSIFSISHLSDSERMFFVTLLLNEIVAWMRAQSGTTSLRALVFMDEIFGYFPPVAAPPSKPPLLTLLKQARAFGVGVLLASQNPIDLDYKGLSNAGTWFIGRLQTERDKMRLLDGLEGAASGSGAQFDRQRMDRMLSELGTRVFLMNNIHNQGPEVFESRWTLSYLRGPLDRDQIKTLTKPLKVRSTKSAPLPTEPLLSGPDPALAIAPSTAGGSTISAVASTESAPASQHVAAAKSPAAAGPAADRLVLPPGIQQYFLPLPTDPPAGSTLLYQPMVLASASVRFVEQKSQIDVAQDLTFLVPFVPEPLPVDWPHGTRVKLGKKALSQEPEKNAAFDALPPVASQPASYKVWQKDFVNWLYCNRKLQLLKSTALAELSKPFESERDFRVRLALTAREKRDAGSAQLRAKYGPKMAALQDRIRRAEMESELQQQAAQAEQVNSAIAAGATLFGAFMGRRTVSVRSLEKAGSAVRGMERASKRQQHAALAAEELESAQAQLAQLESEFNQEMSGLERKYDAQNGPLESVAIAPRKTNITVSLLALVWAPAWRDGQGKVTKIWC